MSKGDCDGKSGLPTPAYSSFDFSDRLLPFISIQRLVNRGVGRYHNPLRRVRQTANNMNVFRILYPNLHLYHQRRVVTRPRYHFLTLSRPLSLSLPRHSVTHSISIDIASSALRLYIYRHRHPPAEGTFARLFHRYL